MTETTPETLLADTRAALATARSELETVLAVGGPRTEADTLGPYHRLQLALERGAPGRAPVGGAPRQAAPRGGGGAVQEIERLRDRAVAGPRAVRRAGGGTVEQPTPDTRRFLEHTLRDYRRAGVDKRARGARAPQADRRGADAARPELLEEHLRGRARRSRSATRRGSPGCRPTSSRRTRPTRAARSGSRPTIPTTTRS